MVFVSIVQTSEISRPWKDIIVFIFWQLDTVLTRMVAAMFGLNHYYAGEKLLELYTKILLNLK